MHNVNNSFNYTKSYYTIGEVADILNIDQHVIRFWSDKFKDYINPLIKAGNRRNYSPQDIEQLSSIKNLLYVRGLSIKGVQLLLKEGKSNINIDLTNNIENNFSVNKNNFIIKLQNINNKIKQYL